MGRQGNPYQLIASPSHHESDFLQHDERGVPVTLTRRIRAFFGGRDRTRLKKIAESPIYKSLRRISKCSEDKGIEMKDRWEKPADVAIEEE
jgi:hypothetical protein